MHVDISDEGDLGRVTAVAPDCMRAWVRLATGRTITITARSHPLTHAPGDTLFVTDLDVEPAPDEAWAAAEAKADPGQGAWVGTVVLRGDDLTIIDLGFGAIRPVPTSAVPYDVGNTVEGTDAAGVPVSCLTSRFLGLTVAKSTSTTSASTGTNRPTS